MITQLYRFVKLHPTVDLNQQGSLLYVNYTSIKAEKLSLDHDSWPDMLLIV